VLSLSILLSIKSHESAERKVAKKLLTPANDTRVISSRWKFYPYYIQKCGWSIVFSIIVCNVCLQGTLQFQISHVNYLIWAESIQPIFIEIGLSMGSNHCLSKAMNKSDDPAHQESRKKNFGLYALLGISQGKNATYRSSNLVFFRTSNSR